MVQRMDRPRGVAARRITEDVILTLVTALMISCGAHMPAPFVCDDEDPPDAIC
jgi:hypothetical protein